MTRGQIILVIVVVLAFASTLSVCDCDSLKYAGTIRIVKVPAEKPADKAQSKRAPTKPVTKCELRLRLPREVDYGQRFHALLEIKNTGTTPVTLVMPGDGSTGKARTPLVRWSIERVGPKPAEPQEDIFPIHSIRFCGNYNSPDMDEIFVLKPGESKSINDWTACPQYPLPGKYRVRIHYSNAPELKWSSGVLWNKEGVRALRKIRRSTPIKLVSNEVPLKITRPIQINR